MSRTQPFGSVVKTVKGKKPEHLYGAESEGLVPYIDIAAVEHGRRRQFAEPSESRIVPEGTLVMVWDGARFGWTGTTKFRGALGSTLAALDSPLETDYLAAFLRSNFRFINTNPRGTGIPHVNPQLLNALEIPMVEPEQQKAIAKRAATIADNTDACLARLLDAAATSDHLRRLLLVKACTGNLTEEWRRNNPSRSAADEIAEAHVEVERVRRGVDPSIPAMDYQGLPSTWAVMTVSQLLTTGVLIDLKDGNHGANHPKVAEFTDTGLPFIAANLVRDGKIDYDNAPKVSGAVLDRLRVGFSEPGDVILTHKGSVGRVALATASSVLTPQTTYYRCNDQLLLPEYLAVFLESALFYEELSSGMAQTTRDFVPILRQYGLSVIVPPLAEQKEIVRSCHALLTQLDRASAGIERAHTLLTRTAEAALASAFRAGDYT